MQLLQNWDPLKLPHGSVRALMTLALSGVLWAFLLLDREIPPVLAFVCLLAVGHYYGFRGSQGAEATGKPPLYLPRGSIRFILFAGFALVSYLLWRDGMIDWDAGNRNFVVLLIAAGLLLGFLVRKVLDIGTGTKTVKPRQWLENTKAVLAIIATAAFVFSCVLPDQVPDQASVVLATGPFIVFYFGSRK